MSFFQILLRACAQEKQDGVPFWVLALLLSHTEPTLPHTHSIQGPSPVIIFLKHQYNWRDYTVKCWKRNQIIILAKFVTEIPISFNSKYCLLDLFKIEPGGTHLPQ